MHEPIPLDDEELAKRVIGAAIEVHRELGLGFGELVYERALCRELELLAIPFRRQKKIPVLYKGVVVGLHRPDIVVDERLVFEIKCVGEICRIHQRQIVSYLKATGLRLGFLINFEVHMLRDGICRVVH